MSNTSSVDYNTKTKTMNVEAVPRCSLSRSTTLQQTLKYDPTGLNLTTKSKILGKAIILLKESKLAH